MARWNNEISCFHFSTLNFHNNIRSNFFGSAFSSLQFSLKAWRYQGKLWCTGSPSLSSFTFSFPQKNLQFLPTRFIFYQNWHLLVSKNSMEHVSLFCIQRLEFQLERKKFIFLHQTNMTSIDSHKQADLNSHSEPCSRIFENKSGTRRADTKLEKSSKNTVESQGQTMILMY